MKKYLQFLKYAFKEQRQYRTNFFASIGTMLFNDACLLIIFIIFLGFFTGTGLSLGNFLALTATSCIGYGIVHGLLFNIGSLPDIIESGKLDYYLSFPAKPLPFLATTKLGMTDLGDILFGTLCIIIYAFVYADNSWITLGKGLAVLVLSGIIILGLYILIGSISFWLQKGSKVADLFSSMFLSFSTYPPEIYEGNKIIYVFMCLLLFPGVILPYKMMIGTSTLQQWLLFIGFAILMMLLGTRVFRRGLKRYSSGNLVHQM